MRVKVFFSCGRSAAISYAVKTSDEKQVQKIAFQSGAVQRFRYFFGLSFMRMGRSVVMGRMIEWDVCGNATDVTDGTYVEQPIGLYVA